MRNYFGRAMLGMVALALAACATTTTRPPVTVPLAPVELANVTTMDEVAVIKVNQTVEAAARLATVMISTGIVDTPAALARAEDLSTRARGFLDAANAAYEAGNAPGFLDAAAEIDKVMRGLNRLLDGRPDLGDRR